MNTRSLTDIWSNQGCAVGAALQIPSPHLVEMLGLGGFDFVMLDGEHGYINGYLPMLLIAATAAGVIPVYRPADHARGALLNALEAGAAALQVPMVGSVEEAQELVREVKFAPLGQRGVSCATRAAQYGRMPASDLLRQNQSVSLILQLETREALAQAEQIAELPGVDALFIGPSDLAQSMGLAGQPTDPQVVRAVDEAIRRLANRTIVGVSAFSREEARRWRDAGARYLLTSTTLPLCEALAGQARMLRAGIAP